MQPSLFGGVPPAPVKEPKPVVGVRWSDYRPAKHVQCDDCVALAHEAAGVGSILGARRKRVTADGQLVLCRPHAEVRHERDVRQGRVGRGSGNAAGTRKPRREVS